MTDEERDRALDGLESVTFDTSRELADAAIGRFLQSLTQPAPGYREIANGDGIRWHRRIEGDG